MKIFEVRVMTDEEADAKFLAAVKMAHTGQKFPGDEGVFFTSLESALSAFTEKRLALLSLIKNHSPRSINQLAKIAGRDFKNVHTDVMLFKNLGIVRIPAGRRPVEPLKVLYDAISMTARV
ncbi:MAG: hypothetical protein PHS14_10710 [Elusimicrobia bacterium]|nr:hypothetical protein [Elusimicrobiota bacterium]